MVPGGTLDTGQGSFNVEVPGLITTPADVYSLPLKTSGDTVVTFGDVAQITRTFKDATSYADVNGQPAITLRVVKKLGTNVINVVDQGEGDDRRGDQGLAGGNPAFLPARSVGDPPRACSTRCRRRC